MRRAARGAWQPAAGQGNRIQYVRVAELADEVRSVLEHRGLDPVRRRPCPECHAPAAVDPNTAPGTACDSCVEQGELW
jgi:hypothetical protein